MTDTHETIAEGIDGDVRCGCFSSTFDLVLDGDLIVAVCTSCGNEIEATEVIDRRTLISSTTTSRI